MSKGKLPSNRILRKMKFISDQKGIMNRYLAEGDAWESHLRNTRDFIVACLEGASPDSVAFLGSGWLLDIPWEYVMDSEMEVFLVDIVHPIQIRKKAEKIPEIKLVQADLTGGGIRGSWELAESYRNTGSGSILDISFQASLAGVSADYYVSLNILNQLDILLLEFLESRMELPGHEKDQFRSRIQQQHLDLLPTGRSCLITDVEEFRLNRKGEQVSSASLMYIDLPSEKRKDSWTWEFDSRGEYRKGFSTRMQVGAYSL